MSLSKRKLSVSRVSSVIEKLEDRTHFSFGFVSSGTNYVIDTGGGVVFTIAKSGGNMTSAKFNGREMLGNKPSHYESGMGGTVSIQENASAGWIKATDTDSSLGVTQYYMVHKGSNSIDMATYAKTLPNPGEMRYIAYFDRNVFTHVNPAADIRGKTAIEASDVYADSHGITASKFYSPTRNIDDQYHGITGTGIGAFMWVGNRESGSGGPFFKDIQQQNDTLAELYNYMYSGHTQTENFRSGLQGPYSYVFTTGGNPSAPDYSYLAGLGLTGYVPASGRGNVSGTASGLPSGFQGVVGLSNATAQYWAYTNSSGGYSINGVKPGTYTATFYKGELSVATAAVAVTAGHTSGLNLTDHEFVPANKLFQIGNWDGTPSGFLNATALQTEHPSDSRMSPWRASTFTVGSSSTGSFPAVEWKGVNPVSVVFNLTSSQVGSYIFRVGITISQFGARPSLTVNGNFNTPTPAAPNEPNSRGVTRGTYRGNNVIFSFSIPASALHAGSNTVAINVVSGSSGSGFLNPAFAFDAIDMEHT